MQIKELGAAAERPLMKSYQITVEAADIARATEAELKELGRKVKIPGFRPGHVPVKVLQQRYGGGVQADVLKNVVQESTQKAIEQNRLKIAMTPDVKVQNYQEGGDLVFTLEVETMPELPAIAYDTISIERETYELDEKEIDAAVRKVAERNPKLVPLPADAKAGRGDVVTMDFIGRANGVAFEGGRAKDFAIEIGSGRLIDTFEEQLIGLKAGDERRVQVTFPPNYFTKDLAGKPAEFEVTVKEVAKLETPEADEEFATARGFADLRAFREAVRGQAKADYDALVRARLKKRLFDALEEAADFPLPKKMVEMEFDAIWGRLQREKDTEGDVYEGRGEEAVKGEYRQIAARRVKLGILLADIGQREKLQVSRDELTKALMEHAGQFPGQEQAVFEFYRKNPARLDELRGPILEEKAVDWVIGRVKVQDKPVSVAELSESTEEMPESAEEGGRKSTARKTPARKKATSGSDNE